MVNGKKSETTLNKIPMAYLFVNVHERMAKEINDKKVS